MELFSLVIPIFLGPALAANCSDVYSRNDFPDGFVFASAASAYQWEGAANEDGRTPSFRDDFAHAENGDTACDGYHKYEDDARLMVDVGLDAYRLSISWSRLIPSYPMLHNSSLHDTSRVKYIHAYIGAVLSAVSFGLYYVDFGSSGLKRSPKLSAHLYSGFSRA